MKKRTDAVIHRQFSWVLCEELSNHGIGVGKFMASCPIKHDNFSLVKKDCVLKLCNFKKVVNAFGDFIFDPAELDRVKRRLAEAAFDD